MTKLGERLIKAAEQARDIAAGNADPTAYRVHDPANDLFRALHDMHRPLEFEWRGKSVRLLTPDEVVAFANAMYRVQGALIEQRDVAERQRDRANAQVEQYRARAKFAENACGNDPAPAYDTTAERDMDMGDRVERLTKE